MRNVLFIFVSLLSSISVWAQDKKDKQDKGEQACQAFLAKAKVNPVQDAQETSSQSNADQLLRIYEKVAGFTELAEQGVDKKMTWDEFKSFALKEKAAAFSDSSAPEYARLYMTRHCGPLKTQATTDRIPKYSPPTKILDETSAKPGLKSEKSEGRSSNGTD